MNDRIQFDSMLSSSNPEVLNALETIFPLIRDGKLDDLEEFLQTVPELESELREYISTMQKPR